LIYALQHAPADTARALRRVIETGGLESLALVVRAIHDTGALAYTKTRAQQYADQSLRALAELPRSNEISALKLLASYAMDRRC